MSKTIALVLGVCLCILTAIVLDAALMLRQATAPLPVMVAKGRQQGTPSAEPISIARAGGPSARGQLGPPPPVPSLVSPERGANISGRVVTFTWSQVNARQFVGVTLRVKTVSNMDDGGDTLLDTGVDAPATSKTFTISDTYASQELYWSVRSWGAGGESSQWASPSLFVVR